jgi:predicted secreted protein
VKKKPIPILCSLIFTLFLFGCSYKKIEFDTKRGKTNTVKAGDKFRISLSENHQQNYYWSLRHNSNKKAVDYLGSVFHGDKSGDVDFNFEALQAGETEISLNLNHYNESMSSVTYRITVVK